MNNIVFKMTLGSLIFLYIFGPDLSFLPLKIVAIIGLISVIIIFFKYQKLLIKIIAINLPMFVILTLLIVYSFIIEILNGVQITTNNPSILSIRIFIEAISPSILLSIVLIKRNYDFEKLLKLLIWLSALQIIFIILMFDFDFKYYMFESIMKISENNVILIPQIFSTRIFGLAKNYLFAFPFAQGLFIVLIFVIVKITSNRLYLLLIIPILISIILNARIGLVPIAVYFLLSIFFIKINMGRLLVRAFTYIMVVFVGLFIFNQLQENETFKRASDRTYTAVEDTRNLFNNSEAGIFNALINHHIHLPDTVNGWIFGSGLKEKSEFERSDIGYIRYLNYGGLIYSLLIYGLFIIVFYRIFALARYYNQKQEIRLISVVFLVSFFLSQVKGDIFVINESIRLLFLLFIFLQINSKNTEKKYD
jgi:hypothetical protein